MQLIVRVCVVGEVIDVEEQEYTACRPNEGTGSAARRQSLVNFQDDTANQVFSQVKAPHSSE